MSAPMPTDDLDALLDGPRVLTIDLERLPGQFTRDIWEGRDLQRLNYLHPDRWDVLPSTLCFSAKWHGKPKIMFHATWDEPDNPTYLAEKSWDLINEADVVVTFNGRRADEKWLRQDWVLAGLVPPSPYKSVDLYVTARREFAFESKSLRHLCDRLGLESKWGHYDPDEAKAAAAGDQAAQRRLAKYNKIDTKITEQVLDRLGPFVREFPNVGLYTRRERCCWRCGSEELQHDGYAQAASTVYARLQCRSCGAWNRLNHRKHGMLTRPAR